MKRIPKQHWPLLCLLAASSAVAGLAQLTPAAAEGDGTLQAFITSSTGTGDLDTWPDAAGQEGLAADDAICRAYAFRAGLSGGELNIAWLRDGPSPLDERFTTNLVMLRPDGARVAAGISDLAKGILDASLNVTESGEYLGGLNASLKAAWTRAFSPNSNVGNPTCSGWTEGSRVKAAGEYRGHHLGVRSRPVLRPASSSLLRPGFRAGRHKK